MSGAKKMTHAWWSIDRAVLRRIKARLIKTLPVDWITKVDHMVKPAASEPFDRRVCAQIEALQGFEAKYGDAIEWRMDDAAICDMAQRVALDLCQVLDTLHPHENGLIEWQRCDVVQRACECVGVPPPASITAAGMVERARSQHWWRRVLRRQVARITELGAIELGLVSRGGSVYVSNEAMARRKQQIARNAANLKKSLWRNEAGQVYSLAELAAKSIANQDNRRDELMTRIRGAMEYAEEKNHVGLFLTLTAPACMHAVRTVKGSRVVLKNDRYIETSPKDVQAWLCKRWALVRAAFARAGIECYGMRVAEPHHDGTPHWHALLWFENKLHAALARLIVRSRWLAEYGDEPGAENYRVSFTAMKKGGAAGYIAKYISKNINSSRKLDSHIDVDKGVQYELDTGQALGAARVDAWAATWGIRQFQAVGMPPIGVWRALRGVSRDQVRERDVSKPMMMAHDAAHRVGERKADFAQYIKAMGGMCQGVGNWALSIGREVHEKVNGFAEDVKQSLTVGVQDASGRLYVSRRMAWVRVVDAPAQSEESRAALAAPWTRFNNCTARLTGGVVKQLFDRVLYDSFDITAMRWQQGMRCQT